MSDYQRDSAKVRASGFYQDPRWRATSKAIFDRDGGVCQICGKIITGRYVCDHIVELTMENKHLWDIAYNPDNLRTTHIECHNQRHRVEKQVDNAHSPHAYIEDGKSVDFDVRDKDDKWKQLREKYGEE